MGPNDEALTREYRRETQTGAARLIEAILRSEHLPPVKQWEIAESGIVRGRLAEPDPEPVQTMRAAQKAFRGSLSVRSRDCGHELVLTFEYRMWDAELLAYIPSSPARVSVADVDPETAELRAAVEETGELLARVGWIKHPHGPIRHTACGWWQLRYAKRSDTGGYPDTGWYLYGPLGTTFGEYMARRKVDACTEADRYIAAHKLG
ncbi:hypothetical protein ACFV2X_48005 [Streptomyces sp. NPDC059679]|uniref:hypothetical protein n=1 Tax=Streptomyces sp. NPDC059679 TaxID=3346903 RepID=UPI0036C118AC